VLAGRRRLEQISPRVSTVRQGLRILLVEDHPDTAELLSSLLEQRGHEVVVAGSVGDALRLAAETPFDLVVSDVGLPDATGYDLMRQLLARMPIRGIALSGWGRPEDIAKSRAAGFSEHLTKPVRLDALEQAIARVIDGSAATVTG
jgi:CheY-like chemotaxis protein